LVIVSGVVGFVALDRYLDPFDDRPFNVAEWAAADEQRRGPMARDAARHVPSGMTAERVRELLGEPNETMTDNPFDKWGRRRKGSTRWSYWLGCWSGLGWYGFDSADLDVYFDQEGCVVEREIDGG
jgi:outer membrane protein assembly factor BamE (lipoprotein component of BamABCDE complex)